MTLKASCTWGDGPDVLLVLENDGKGDWLMAYEDPHHPAPPQGDTTHGYIREGSICLTAADAEAFAAELIAAARMARDLDREYAEHMELDMMKKKWKDTVEKAERKVEKARMEWKNLPA